MTIPRNLSFLAEGASSTGVLGTANGGTGLNTLGTAGQALVVNSGATGLTYSTPSAGAMTLISTQTASGTTVSFTGLSGYDKYLVVFSGINQNTSAGNLRFVFGTGSTTYITSSYNTYEMAVYTGSSTPSGEIDANASYAYINAITAGGYSTTGTSGFLYIQNFNGVRDASFQSQSISQFASSSYAHTTASGSLTGNSTTKTAIQFSNNSGTSFAGGTISLYGISS